MDDSHEVTFVNGKPGVALTCHGPTGHGAGQPAGHSLAAHDGLYRKFDYGDDEIPFPCRFCGCTASMVLAALGIRTRALYRQVVERDGPCSTCGAAGYRVGSLPVLCLAHLADHVGLDRSVIFGAPTR